MEIIHYEGETTFAQIPIGTVFTEKENCYLKISTIPESKGYTTVLRNAVNLKTGELHYALPSTEIIPHYLTQLILR